MEEKEEEERKRGDNKEGGGGEGEEMLEISMDTHMEKKGRSQS